MHILFFENKLSQHSTEYSTLPARLHQKNMKLVFNRSSGGSRRGSGGSFEPRSEPTTLLPFKNILWKGIFDLSEIKLYRFHGIFKDNEIKSAKSTPHSIIYEPPFLKSWIHPWEGIIFWEKLLTVHLLKYEHFTISDLIDRLIWFYTAWFSISFNFIFPILPASDYGLFLTL